MLIIGRLRDVNVNEIEDEEKIISVIPYWQNEQFQKRNKYIIRIERRNQRILNKVFLKLNSKCE